jgi:TetR/AcrR family transcriptional regulator, cholesterol catabolism regulator
LAAVVVPAVSGTARSVTAEPVAETRRRQIETVASALFRERGYAGTGMREIARLLQLQGASLYSHIGSKEDVLLAIVERAADRFAAAINPHATSDARPRDRLRAMIRAHVSVVTDDLAAAAVYLHEWRFLGPERREIILGRRDAYERAFRRVIAEGVEAGDFRPVDQKIAARSLLSSLNGIATWWHPDGPMTAAAIADTYADLHLAGLLAEPSTTTEASRRRTRR